VRAAAKLVGCSWNASFSGQTCIRKPDVKATIFQVVLPCRIKKTARLRSESPAAEVPLIPGLEGGYVRSSEGRPVFGVIRSRRFVATRGPVARRLPDAPTRAVPFVTVVLSRPTSFLVYCEQEGDDLCANGLTRGGCGIDSCISAVC